MKMSEAVVTAKHKTIGTEAAALTIGVTGVTGSGKTTVTRILEKHGAYAVIADELSHGAILRGNPPYNAVLDAFGREILGGGLEIDRGKLGCLVFGKPEKMAVLEGIIHPYVFDLTAKLTAEAISSGKYKFAVIDVPMLIEAGFDTLCGKVWVVTAPNDLKIERIVKRDGITRQAAEKRLSARNEAALFSFADEIIVNTGSVEELERDVTGRLRAGSFCPAVSGGE